MGQCSNCGMNWTHLSGPQGDLCNQCLEFMGPALNNNDYPSSDNTLKDLNKDKEVKDYMFYFGIKTVDGKYTNEHIEFFEKDPKKLKKWIKIIKNFIKLIKESRRDDD